MDLVKIRKKIQEEKKGERKKRRPKARTAKARETEEVRLDEREWTGAESQEGELLTEESPDIEIAGEDFPELTGEELFGQAVGDEEEIEEPLEILCFMLANEEYAVDIMEIKEVIKVPEITEVPRVPEFVLGIISLRGTIIPVFDLRKRLGLKTKEMSRATKIIIASDNGKNLGMVVDKVTQVARISGKKLEPPPPVIGGVEAEYIQGLGRFRERLLILLNLQKVLGFEVNILQLQKNESNR
ncbi:MAG: chemotaxis protein CheW [Deltaproteobacteria bacterium]|nr:MAG: chemotaxis protein CheW [Deltaproteobacteria bacterium]